MLKRLILFSVIILFILSGCSANASLDIREEYEEHAYEVLKYIDECRADMQACNYLHVHLAMLNYIGNYSPTESTSDESELFLLISRTEGEFHDLFRTGEPENYKAFMEYRDKAKEMINYNFND